MTIPWLNRTPSIPEVLTHEPLRGGAWTVFHTGRWLVVWADRLVGEIVQLRVMGGDICTPIDAKQVSTPGSWAPVTRRITRCLPVTEEGIPCFVEQSKRDTLPPAAPDAPLCITCREPDCTSLH